MLFRSQDLLDIARSRCDTQLFDRMRTCYDGKDSFCDMKLVFNDGHVMVHRLVLAAASQYLHTLLLDTQADCLMFPDISVSVGKLAVEALYTGNVKINKRAISSLTCVERCVRTFQEVGLLQHYSIQISSMLQIGRAHV